MVPSAWTGFPATVNRGRDGPLRKNRDQRRGKPCCAILAEYEDRRDNRQVPVFASSLPSDENSDANPCGGRGSFGREPCQREVQCKPSPVAGIAMVVIANLPASFHGFDGADLDRRLRFCSTPRSRPII